MEVTDKVAETGLGRDAAIIALGGGVAGDLAGFVAATYHRGIPYIQLPTTLLAMVDSSIGGKTGVDTSHGKNLVGAFHQPRVVVADTATLETLPAQHLVNGMAEVIKHAAIADADHFNDLVGKRDRILGRDPEILHAVVSRSAMIKSEVVSADPYERGSRAILNLGHSIGHALEAASGFRIPHGQCVAAGMYLEALVGQALDVTRSSVAPSFRSALDAYGFPRADTFGLSTESVMDAVTFDKKNRRSKLKFALLNDLGNPAQTKGESWTFEVPEKVLRNTLKSEL